MLSMLIASTVTPNNVQNENEKILLSSFYLLSSTVISSTPSATQPCDYRDTFPVPQNQTITLVCLYKL